MSLRFVLLISAGLLVIAAPTPTFATDPYAFIEENPLAESMYVGCILGQNWTGFPTHRPNGYEAGDQLNITLPLYVTWILVVGDTTQLVAQRVDPPQPITSYAWFQNVHDLFKVTEARVEEHEYYTQCPVGTDLEAPALNSFPLNANGELHVQDVHGGIGAATAVRLSRFFDGTQRGVHLYIGWASPANRVSVVPVEGSANYRPGDVWVRYRNLNQPPFSWRLQFDSMTVEWTCADFKAPSPTCVDASDLMYFVVLWNDIQSGPPEHYVRWGFPDESPPNSPTFEADLVCQDGNHVVDASDLSRMADQLGKHCPSCGQSKGSDGENAATIMAWFGFSPTGRLLVIGTHGETAPEYEQTDPNQTAIALRDPFGYRTHVAGARELPWSTVKGLYR